MVQFQRAIESPPILIGFTTDFKKFMTDYFRQYPSEVLMLSEKQCISQKNQKHFYSAILIEEGICKFHWMRGIDLVKIVHNVIEGFHRKYRFINWLL